jgi:exodeoxyribonuclease VII large subunit
MADPFYTVSQLNNTIKGSINTCFPHLVWVCGEVQGFDRNKNKSHVFFELVETEGTSKTIKSKIGLVIFAGKKAMIDDILRRSENAFTLKDDIEVKFACRVDYYAPHGAMRLTVESIDPVYTLGKAAQEKQKLIALLTKNGTLTKNKHNDLSLVPLKIGLITSDDSAAYNDFINELESSGLGFEVILRNATMQGAKTEGDICRAIGELEKISGLGAIIITRGGGSLADLSCFDSQKMAECIAACKLPILSGIGHEINTSITDLAAHTTAKTPTAIAQFLVNRINDYLEVLDVSMQRVVDLAQEYVQSEKQSLKDSAYQLQTATTDYLKEHNNNLVRLKEVLRLKPNELVRQQKQKVTTVQQHLARAAVSAVGDARTKIKNFERMIALLHPENTLRRGFSITRNQDGDLVRVVEDVKKGGRLRTQVLDGVVWSVVGE